MTTTDIATRVYSHAFKLDPIIRSLLDTDVYKLLRRMRQRTVDGGPPAGTDGSSDR